MAKLKISGATADISAELAQIDSPAKIKHYSMDEKIKNKRTRSAAAFTLPATITANSAAAVAEYGESRLAR